jgi:hypothetical protein
VERLLPVIDEVNQRYWAGAREQRLVLQRCPECRTWVHPPRPMCPKCQSEKVDYEQASGKGKIYTWSVMHNQGNPGFEDKVPFACVVVELDEQPHLFTVGNIDCPLGAIEIGLPVEVTYEKVTDEITLPQWRPTGRGAGQ